MLPGRIAAALVAIIVATLSPVPVISSASNYHPIKARPELRAGVPDAEEVIGFEIRDQAVTAAQADEYLRAVDEASRRVRTGVLATSVRGRPLSYALIGKPNNATDAGIARIQTDVQALRDPHTSRDESAAISGRTPAVL